MNSETNVRVAGENGHLPASAETRNGRSPEASRPGRPAPPTQTPLIDIHETNDGLVLEADLPGVAQDDVTIQLEDNVLTLHAKVARREETTRTLHCEFPPGDFQRSFILSDEVDRDRITAVQKNGVLTLVLPKAERARTRKIPIQTS